MIHESDTYYERCYAADVDPAISMETRHQCWALWLEHYTPGQPPDRVGHARERLAELEAGVAAAPLPDMPPLPATASEQDAGVALADGSAPPGAPLDGAVAPADGAVAPTSGTDAAPTAPPAPDSPEVRANYRPPPPVRTTTACDPVCLAAWEECVPRCDDRTRSCMAACQARYRSCQAACY